MLKEQARINGRKGGIASAKARKRKKTFKELINTIGEMVVNDPNLLKKTKVNSLDVKQKDITYAFLVAFRQYQKAITKGDTRAAEFLRDTAGEKPLNQVEVNQDYEDLTPLADLLKMDEDEK